MFFPQRCSRYGHCSLCAYACTYGRAGARTATYITRCAGRNTFGNHAGPNAQALDRGACSGVEWPADVEHGSLFLEHTPGMLFSQRCSRYDNGSHVTFDCTYGRAGAWTATYITRCAAINFGKPGGACRSTIGQWRVQCSRVPRGP